MIKRLTCFIIIFLAITSLATGQQPDSTIFSLQKGRDYLPLQLKDFFIYYNYYNGVEMIEVDCAGYEKNLIAFLDASQPINSIRRPSGAPSWYFFRDESGKIIASYNTGIGTGTVGHEFIMNLGNYQDSDFVAPQKLIGKTISHKGRPALLYVYSNNKCGIIDTLGAFLMDLKYDAIQADTFNYCFKLDGKWGLKNRHFKTLIQPKYTQLIYQRNNVYKACKENCGLIDSNDNVLVKFKYDDIFWQPSFYFYESDSDYMYNNHNYKYIRHGIMGADFKIQTGPLYTSIESFYVPGYRSSPYVKQRKNYYYAVKRSGGGLLDSNGVEVTAFKYSCAPREINTGYYMVEIKPAWDSKVARNYFRGYMDSTFKEVGEIKYDNVGSFYKGYGTVSINGKTGFIDSTGKQVIDCRYDIANYFTGGLAYVSIGQYGNVKSGMINRKGEVVVPIKYDYWETSKEDKNITRFCNHWREETPVGEYVIQHACDCYKRSGDTMKPIKCKEENK